MFEWRKLENKINNGSFASLLKWVEGQKNVDNKWLYEMCFNKTARI